MYADSSVSIVLLLEGQEWGPRYKRCYTPSILFTRTNPTFAVFCLSLGLSEGIQLGRSKGRLLLYHMTNYGGFNEDEGEQERGWGVGGGGKGGWRRGKGRLAGGEEWSEEEEEEEEEEGEE